MAQTKTNKKPLLWRIISRFTMTEITPLFIDVVNGKHVNLYIDKYGIEWIAQSKFGYRTQRN